MQKQFTFKFSENAKNATVRPIFKEGDRTEIKNYRPVSLLNIFSIIYDRFLHENLTNYIDTFLSKFISAYRKSYSSNHVLIRLIGSWEKSLDQKKFVGAVLKDLSKAFDSIPMTFLLQSIFYAYLKRGKENVRINNTHSIFQILLSGIPQGTAFIQHIYK